MKGLLEKLERELQIRNYSKESIKSYNRVKSVTEKLNNDIDAIKKLSGII